VLLINAMCLPLPSEQHIHLSGGTQKARR
jgi:hypothetical protein